MHVEILIAFVPVISQFLGKVMQHLVFLGTLKGTLVVFCLFYMIKSQTHRH